MEINCETRFAFKGIDGQVPWEKISINHHIVFNSENWRNGCKAYFDIFFHEQQAIEFTGSRV